MIRLRNSCYDSILLCLPEICDGLGLEVTQLVAEHSHDHRTRFYLTEKRQYCGTPVVLTIKPRAEAMSALRGSA